MIQRQFALLALLVMALGACAGEVVDIDRTQPNRLQKSIFEGEWYYRPTVVEAAYNQGFIFEGFEGPMERVRWRIEEHELIAYRSYELLVDGEQGNGDPEFLGNPVAIFAIKEHFDVIREYNTATGEQTNVLVENTTDRPWFERQYMRVDWSQNLLHNEAPYTIEGFFQAYSGAPYYVQEHEVDSPFRAEVTPTHINVVANYHMINDLETCVYTFLDAPEWCGGSDVKMKLSFLRLDTRASDYEPLYYPDRLPIKNTRSGETIVRSDENDPSSFSEVYVDMNDRFGFFRTERRAYDDEYQWTRNGRVFLINRWNMWRTSRDASGAPLPMTVRTPGKITYYTNAEFPVDEDAWAASQEIAADWDSAFREIVAYYQSKDVAGVRDAVFELRANSCSIETAQAYAERYGFTDALSRYGIGEVQRGNLTRACAILEHVSRGSATPFAWEKPGDLRYSFFHWVDTPQRSGPLGYGPSSSDPITGEIISANANIYGASVDAIAATAADYAALMNGELTTDEVLSGANIRRHMEARRGQLVGAFAPEKLRQFTARLEGLRANMERGLSAQQRAALIAGQTDWFGRFDRLKRAHRTPEALMALRMPNDERLRRFAGTALEREILASDELKRAMLGPGRYQPGGAVDPGAAPLAPSQTQTAADFSPITGMLDELALGKRHELAMQKVMGRSITLPVWSDDGMASLAEQLRGLSWEEVYAFMRRQLYRSVMAHEVGHTLGLRHNFEGSYDALNYNDEFWRYYDADGNGVDPVTGKELCGKAGTVCRQYADGTPTRAERLMYSSIMDYDARFYADSIEGIGRYDRAAVKFGYGELVEVFPENSVTPFFSTQQLLHDYTQLPKFFDGAHSCDVLNSSALYTDDTAGYFSLQDFTTENCPVSASSSLSGEFFDVLTSGRFDFFRDSVESMRPNPGGIAQRTHMTWDAYVEHSRDFWNVVDDNPDAVAWYEISDSGEYSLVVNPTREEIDARNLVSVPKTNGFVPVAERLLEHAREVLRQVTAAGSKDEALAVLEADAQAAWEAWQDAERSNESATVVRQREDEFAHAENLYNQALGNDTDYEQIQTLLRDNVAYFEELLREQETSDYAYQLPSEVPYKFCTDELSGYSFGFTNCRPYDKGASMTEVIQDYAERYNKYYFFTNFKRDQYGFFELNPGSYLLRLYSRYFLPMADVYQNALFAVFLSLGLDDQGQPITFLDFSVGQDWQLAAMLGLNTLTSVMEQPSPGDYCLDAASNTYVPEGAYLSQQALAGNPVADCSATQTLNVPLGVGKYFGTRWNNDYYYKPTRIGTYYDKYVALFAMTDNSGRFFQDFSDILDAGAFSLSYWRGLDDEMMELFSAAFLGQQSRFAWRYDADAQDTAESPAYLPLPVVDVFDDVSRGMTYDEIEALPKIQSASSWNLRYWAIVLAMARFNSMFDYTQDFTNFARICLKGSPDCLQYEDGGVEFVDPLSGWIYVAPRNDQVQERAVARIMLEEAQEFVDTTYTPARQRYDEAVAALGASQPIVLYPDEVDLGLTQETVMFHRETQVALAERGINDRTGFFDIVRNISSVFEFGQ